MLKKHLSCFRKLVLLGLLLIASMLWAACSSVMIQERPEGEPLVVTNAQPQASAGAKSPPTGNSSGAAEDPQPGNTPTNNQQPTPPAATPSETEPTPGGVQPTAPVQESINFNETETTPIEEQAPTEETGQGENAVRPIFDTFVEGLKNGDPNQIVGVYVDGILALRVVQQPPGNAAYVSVRDGEATQFLLAWTIAGNVGLLAHNYLAGAYYFNLQSGDLVQLIYGDGAVVEYEVESMNEFQAMNPKSPTSDYLNLASGANLSATNLFYEVYGGDHHVTFQTCIARENSSEWGRLFVIAPPL